VKTFKYTVEYHKDPDGLGELIYALDAAGVQTDRYFEFGEYARFELIIDEKMNIVGGKVCKLK
jgi:hypothetical protein